METLSLALLIAIVIGFVAFWPASAILSIWVFAPLVGVLGFILDGNYVAAILLSILPAGFIYVVTRPTPPADLAAERFRSQILGDSASTVDGAARPGDVFPDGPG